MESRLHLRVQRYGWDRAAPSYESAWKSALAPATAGRIAVANLQPGERVLDVACGTGVLTRQAWSAVKNQGGEVVGTDISEVMVAEAAARSPGCQFLKADAQELGNLVRQGHFDVMRCGLGLMYMPDPEAAIATMAGCSRPGGRLALSVWGERRSCGWAEIFPIVDSRVRSEVCPMFFRIGTGDVVAKLFESGQKH